MHRSLRVLLLSLSAAIPLVAMTRISGAVRALPVQTAAATSFTSALLLAAMAALWLTAGWWALLCAAAVLETLGSVRLRPTRALGAPAGLRRLLVGACGVATVVAPITGAHAAAEPGPLPSPERPVGQAALGAASGAPRPTSWYRVQPGDSLWRIASRRHPGATEGRVADLTARVYRDNRSRIGADPDLLLPGTPLRLPPRAHPPKEM